MKKRNRTIIFGLLLSAALTLITPPVVCAQEPEKIAQSTTLPQVKVFQLRPDDVTTLIASSGSLSDNMTRISNVVRAFDAPQDTVAWTVNAPKEDDYVVSVLFSMREQTNIEVSSGESVLVAPSLTRTWENRPFFWR